MMARVLVVLPQYQLVLLAILLLVFPSVLQALPFISRSATDTYATHIYWSNAYTAFVRTNNNTIYRGINSENFINQMSQLPGSGDRIPPYYTAGVRLIVQSVDNDKFYFIGYGRAWSTTNAGNSYIMHTSLNGIPVYRVAPHPSNPDWALASAYSQSCYGNQANCNQTLYLTQDLGNSWQSLRSYVFRFLWSPNVSPAAENRVYATLFRQMSGNQLNFAPSRADLLASDDYFTGNTTRSLLSNATSFIAKGDFVDAVFQPGYYGTLYVSNNFAKSFSSASLPPWIQATLITSAIHSQMLFIPALNNQPFGSLMHSDSSGGNFILSLAAVYFTGATGVDFREFEMLPSIMFANQCTRPGTDTTRRTFMTRDYGGIWTPITPPSVDSLNNPTNCQLSNGCSLHLDLSITRAGSFIQNEWTPNIIICTGNLGPTYDNALQNQNTYMSRDAGLTWSELVKGPYTSAFCARGSIFMIGQIGVFTRNVAFSLDQGTTFTSLGLVSSSDSPIYIQAIVPLPANDTQVFLVFATTQQTSQMLPGVIITVSFAPNGYPICLQNDYEAFIPADSANSQCIFGRSIQFMVRKRASQCIDTRQVVSGQLLNNCQCSAQDFECNFGYTRLPGNGTCVPISSTPAATSTRVIASDSCISN